MYRSWIIFVNFIFLSDASLNFATPHRGFSSSAEARSAAMPRMFNNLYNPAPQMAPIGSGASFYRRDVYPAPFNNNPYLLAPPSAPAPMSQAQPFEHFGLQSGAGTPSLASVLGIAAPPMVRRPCPISPFAKFLSKDEQV